VVVAGGGGIGCETALHLARQGKKVVVVEMLTEAALDFNFINRGMLLELLAEAGVEVRTRTKIVEIRADGVVAEEAPVGEAAGDAAASGATTDEAALGAAALGADASGGATRRAASGGHRAHIPADTVVLALGMAPRTVLVEELRRAAPRAVVVGDCVAPRHIIDAVREGFHAVAEL
jgi:NADPH-dependent 2,4-dienoyl-CoA reductase/sulfur reductase-like enzyme